MKRPERALTLLDRWTVELDPDGGYQVCAPLTVEPRFTGLPSEAAALELARRLDAIDLMLQRIATKAAA